MELKESVNLQVLKKLLMPIMKDVVANSVGIERHQNRYYYDTDTVYFEDLAAFAADSDLLISEGMYGEDEYIPKMTEKGHMVFSQSAEIAAHSHSKELWLTHFSPALTDPEAELETAKAIFPNTIAGKDGMKKTVK